MTAVTTELLLPEQSIYLSPATVPVWPHPKREKKRKRAEAKLTREKEWEQEGGAQQSPAALHLLYHKAWRPMHRRRIPHKNHTATTDSTSCPSSTRFLPPYL